VLACVCVCVFIFLQLLPFRSETKLCVYKQLYLLDSNYFIQQKLVEISHFLKIHTDKTCFGASIKTLLVASLELLCKYFCHYMRQMILLHVHKNLIICSFFDNNRLNVVRRPIKREDACRPVVLADGRTAFRCFYCKKDFCTISDVNRHMDFHEGSYVYCVILN